MGALSVLLLGKPSASTGLRLELQTLLSLSLCKLEPVNASVRVVTSVDLEANLPFHPEPTNRPPTYGRERSQPGERAVRPGRGAPRREPGRPDARPDRHHRADLAGRERRAGRHRLLLSLRLPAERQGPGTIR